MDDASLLRVLKAIAHPKRFRMVQEIAASGELSCGQIGKRFALAQPTISHHLKILGDAGVLVFRRVAQHGFVSVNRALVEDAVELLPRRLAPGGSKPSRPKRSRSTTTKARRAR